MVPIQSLIDAASRGPLATEKPLIFGMIQRGGKVVLRMLDNVQPRTSKPLIRVTIALGTVYTGAYSIYNRLAQWGYAHASVWHSRGEYTQDAYGDGFHAVHGNLMEGFWSLLRSGLHSHRGRSQEHLSFCVGFFACVHNVRRWKALVSTLLDLLLTSLPGTHSEPTHVSARWRDTSPCTR
jgi:hypothetical protein